MATLYDLLKLMIEKGASDLHITTGNPPRMRVNGRLTVVDPEAQPLRPTRRSTASKNTASWISPSA
jgi:twitching motility protein PilT